MNGNPRRLHVELNYEFLTEGETLRGEHCPACEGGETREGSLSVSRRDGILLWNCYRASCRFRGASGGSRRKGTGDTNKVHCRGVVGRTIERQSAVVGEQVRDLLLSKYAITETHLGKFNVGWDEGTNRLCLPVSDFQGERTGVVLRSLSGQQPKVLTHTEQGAISWFTNPTAPGVIIVEDQFSAIRASDYLTSVALLGTNLNDERVTEIKASGLRPVYLALDADAWTVAVRYAIKYRSELGIRLLRLDKDIKDMSNEELSNFFEASL